MYCNEIMNLLPALLLAALQEPGLFAEYGAGDRKLSRVDLKPAFDWGLSSPHPRLPAGPFTVTWTGLLHLVEADGILFDADLEGELAIRVGDKEAFPGRARLELGAGFHPLRIEYRSAAGKPARVQIGWSGRTFTREPLPPWRLKHEARPHPDLLVERGRNEVARLGCAACHPAAFPGLREPPIGPSLAGLERRMDVARLTERLERSHVSTPGLFNDAGERRAVAEQLLRRPPPEEAPAKGDTRQGKRQFQSLGCVACHPVPDEPLDEQPLLNRRSLPGLGDHRRAAELAEFLLDPDSRYPDGRMPKLVQTPVEARDLAAYLLEAAVPEPAPLPPATNADGQVLLRTRRCAACHPGLPEAAVEPVPIRKSGADCGGLRYAIEEPVRRAIALFAEAAGGEQPSAFHDGQRLLARLRCLQCHSRDSERPPPLEEAGSQLGGAFLQRVPFQRTPRLPYVHEKLAPDYLRKVLQDGGTKARGRDYSYRMPAFGARAPEILKALAEGDGSLVDRAEPVAAVPDPTLAPLGPGLVGFEGYSCISCHVWKGVLLTETDPGALGPELTTATTRIRRSWFDRWLEDPARVHPGTPMPQIFKKDQPATLKSVLDGDALKQREALWAFLSLGPAAPSPKPLPPIAIAVPPGGPLVAQIPVRLPDNTQVESICVLYPTHDLLVFEVGGSLKAAYTGARLLRKVRGRLRYYVVEGKPVAFEAPPAAKFSGYERLADGVRLLGPDGAVVWRLEGRKLRRGNATWLELPPAETPPPLEKLLLPDSGRIEGSLERPGFRAIAFPRPKLDTGEDLIMPGAVAVDPRDGSVFVASMKTGSLYRLNNPDGDASFEDYAGGLFQEALSMHAESDGLYVLHRRNLTKVTEQGRRFERVAALPHGVGETYDYAYGLARDAGGAFVLSYAPYANRTIQGSGSLVRLTPSGPESVAYGFRNPLGFASGPEGGIFFTDNQGEWVATSKLGHIEPGRYYGFPNPEQKEHAKLPAGPACVWIPYAWGRCVNGLVWCHTGGRFGPFEGQIFLAELMYGGGILRANVERVNGVMQGACFPFWGKGLLGPLTVTFDTRGRLYVGSITEPGWMAQPDRGALFRIDWTGEVPFELRSIHAQPSGFRLVFTKAVDPKSAAEPASYAVEHYRYEHTGAYGSPELDRTRVEVQRVQVSPDGGSADLVLPPLVKGRVYRIAARGVRSPEGAPLLHAEGAYTLNEIPR